MSEIKKLDTKIQKTKKSARELEEQLKSLIELRNYEKSVKENENRYVCSNQQKQKVNEAGDPKYKCKSNVEHKQCEQRNKDSSPKKLKSYDVHEAREYIKRQRERRSQQNKVNEAKLKEELKKKKLQDLHEKAQELVLKNVQIRQQRSKSRDKEQYVRIDGCNQLQKRSRSISRERNCVANQAKSRINQNPKEELKTNKAVVSNVTFKEVPSSLLSVSSVPIKASCSSPKNCSFNVDKENVNDIDNGVDKLPATLDMKNIADKINIISNITLKPGDIKENRAVITSNLIEVNQTDKENTQNISKIVPQTKTKVDYPIWLQEMPELGHPLNFINTVKRKLQYVVSSPKANVDVGVQSSLQEDKFNVPTVTNSPQKKNGNICDKSNFFVELSNTKSFHSHQHPNLDIKSVEHLELIPKHRSENKSYKFDSHQNVLTDNVSSKPNQKEESESDTSKNIPDISSESGTSLRKNAESVRRNLNPEFNLSIIDSGKINQMKLVPKIKSFSQPTTTIESELQRTAAAEIKNSVQTTSRKSGTIDTHFTGRTYDMDFNSDNDSSPCLSKSRDSILSFNSPDYNRQVIMPFFPNENEVPTGVGSTSQNSLKSANKVPVSSSPKDHSALKTEVISTNGSYKVHGGILNIPEVVISDHHTEESRYSIENVNSSLNSYIPSSIHNESYSSQFETSKSNSIIQNINTKRGSRSSSIMESDTILSLEEPKGSLFNPSEKNRSENKSREEKSLERSKVLKNISLRARNMDANEGEKQNEIHLKFEAEIHLLNDFNQSLRQLSAVEKVVETLKSKNELTTSNILQNKNSQSLKINKELPSCDILQNKDTQTSVGSKTSSATKSTTRMDEREPKFLSKSKSEISSINYSRGSLSGDKSLENDIFKNSLLNSTNERTKSQAITDFDISRINSTKSFFDNNIPRLGNFENLANNQFSGFSLKLFDQLIKDEDARLEHLKMILKIREKALLDRVRAELAWLEIQRKHYKETGNLQEVSVIKKKQRGILLNHQREKHEMQRVKQMQRAASAERKTILKEQRNLIKKQLSTDNMLLKIKVNTPRRRASTGPLKVIQSHTESIMSETSISKKSSTDKEEVYSMTSHHTVSRISEISEVELAMPKVNPIDAESLNMQQNIKRTLLMREAALRKRRKKAEELLQWNQKLLEEEKRINELELRATSIIHQQHNTTTISDEKHQFSGKELNKLWYNLSGCEENKFKDEKIYRMSQIALERFYKSAREYSVKTKKLLSKNNHSDYSVADISVSDNVTKTNNIPSSSVPSSDVEKQSNYLQDSSLSNISVKEYTPDFEVDTTDNVVDVADIDVNENIDELIQNFSRIEDDISSLGSRHFHDGMVNEEKKSRSPKSNQSDSEAEISVIETNKLVKNPAVIAKSPESLEKTQNNNVESATKNHSLTLIEEAIVSTESLKSPGNKSKIITNESVSVETQDNLNESKEILLILGESDNSVNFLEKEQACIGQTTTENVNTTEEILSTLNHLIAEVASDNKIGENSALLVESVPFKDTSLLQSISTEKKEDLNTSDNILSLVADQEVANLLLEEHCTLVTSFNELPEVDSSTYQPDTECLNNIPECYSNKISNDCTIEEDKQNIISLHKQAVVENESSKGTDVEEELTSDIESLRKTDENLVSIQTQSNGRNTLSNIDPLELKSEDVASSSSSIQSIHSEKVDPINEISYKTSSTSDNLEENGSATSISSDVLIKANSGSQQEASSIKEIVAQKLSNNSPSSVVNEIEDFNEKSETSIIVPNPSISTESNEVQNEYDPRDKSDYERNEVPSISNTSNSSLLNNLHTPEQDISVPEDIDNLSTSTKTSPKTGNINIKKRVTEIMAEANHFSKGGDRSPRFQEIYTTTYDLTSPTSSPELVSPVGDHLKIAAITSIFDNEAEEILKKQLAIEQEIKQITEQQQKQQLPYLYVREIPNKPPPPYTPPSSATSSTSSVVVIPSSEEIDEITKYSAKILHKAYLSNNLDNISVSDNTLNLITKDIPKEKYKFVFDLCKDISKDHYMQFDIEKCPTWLQVSVKPQLLIKRPFDVIELEKHITKKLREVFGYEKPQRRENSIIKWSRKKRDHVDEVLVAECQAEDEQWINYEKDELLVIDEVTHDIMNSLFSETADVISEIFSKRLQ